MNPTTCGNCDSPLSGPFCAQCGQHVHDSARSLGALLHDAWHVLTHLDGRSWATLRQLLLHPGRLTVDYFAGRRARYLPPVRLYLILSVLLFALLATTTRVGSGDVAMGGTVQPAAGDGVVQLPRDAAGCATWTSGSPWLERRLQESCRRNAGDRGHAVVGAFKANAPRMMVVFLPLMAAAMSLLYWFPRRYYVEHLVFFLHNHAALFLAMSLGLLLGLPGRAAPWHDHVENWAVLALVAYAAWYVYRSARTFYGQGRLLTLCKLGLVSIAYVLCLGMTVVATLLLSVLTT